ncbi:hypothetical protein SUGI_0330510 [Cryptomeria japonica]|nr:hypothetical protein SUGI_0330510 [Cryptomeria japonica]
MENRQFCSWWSGVPIQDSEQKATAAAAQCSAAPFWSKFSCGIYCAVAIAALCCFYTLRLYKNKKKVQRNQPGASMMEQLVPEITTHALSYLDYQSLCRLSMTNSSMRRAANDDNAWRALYHQDFTTEQDDVFPPNGWKSYYAATKAVTAVNTDYYRILREKNRVHMRHLWRRADYVKCIHPGGPLLTGYEAVMESWEQVLNSDQQYDCQVNVSPVALLEQVYERRLSSSIMLNSYVAAKSRKLMFC